MKTIFAAISVGLLTLALGACAHAQTGLLQGADLASVSVEEMARTLPAGSVLVLGENHGETTHRDQHVQVLGALRAAGHKVSVGLEFFPAAFQNEVTAWRGGELAEADFLKKIGWSGIPFDFYRQQAEFPLLSEGSATLALNASRTLTAKVAKQGLESLTEGERAELPEDFSLGNEAYRTRFLEMMPHLPNPQSGERYFAAQSIWDDTMADRAVRYLKAHPQHTLVIVVGDFHVQYGGGLPDRLRARGASRVFTLSQVNLWGMTAEERLDSLRPSARDGVRADWVWGEEISPSKVEETSADLR